MTTTASSPHPELDGPARRRFSERGYLVLPRALDPLALGDEMERAFADGLARRPEAETANVGGGQVRYHYLPMTCARTPVSLGLVDAFAPTAAELLGRGVLPVRAKGTRYFGDTGWHRDSALDVESIGFLAYLEPLMAESGALRVVPRSARTWRDEPDPRPPADADVLATEPGDVIVFDEHLLHGSSGGGERRQWRVDFVVDPEGPAEERVVREYYAGIFPDTGGGPAYDPRRYPSYGAHWRSLDRPWNRRLLELGVYGMAEVCEGLESGA